MTFIAHLSDLHLLEHNHGERRGLARRRLSYLSAGRPHDAADRRKRAIAALKIARDSGADHVLVTGDLTEDGTDAQYEVLAEVLAESRISPSRVTLIAGNHDVYDARDAFDRALEGPIQAFAETSRAGRPLAIGDAIILPMSTAIAQPYHFSRGSIEPRAIASVASFADGTRRGGRAVIVAMHHPPKRRSNPVMQWFDGFRDHQAVGTILEAHDHVHVVHGHTHEASDRSVREGATPRIFGTDAVVTAESPVRLYHARHGRLSPASASAIASPIPALGSLSAA
jgi:3',5'-cyclic-AMP phosphodiesterase